MKYSIVFFKKLFITKERNLKTELLAQIKNKGLVENGDKNIDSRNNKCIKCNF